VRKILVPLGEAVWAGSRPLVAVLLAFLVSSIFIWSQGVSPLAAYAALFRGAFGSVGGLANTGVRTVPLLLAGLGIAVGLKAGLFNVGAEGQLYMGALGATVVGVVALPFPDWMRLPLAILAGFLAGGLWGVLPGVLRAYRGVNEFVVTLMLNYVAIQFVSYVLHGPFGERPAAYIQSPPILPAARLPVLIKGTSLHAGLLIGLALAVVLYFLMRDTAFGFETRLVGSNSEAARYLGVKVKRQIVLVMVLSAALAGLAGVSEILGLKWRLFDFFDLSLGYDAIGVALLANANPLGVVLVATFFGALRAGANNMQQMVGVETALATVIQSLAVLFVIGLGFSSRHARHSEQQGTADQTGAERPPNLST
jgi:general nucleoside transport system permease protein